MSCLFRGKCLHILICDLKKKPLSDSDLMLISHTPVGPDSLCGQMSFLLLCVCVLCRCSDLLCVYVCFITHMSVLILRCNITATLAACCLRSTLRPLPRPLFLMSLLPYSNMTTHMYGMFGGGGTASHLSQYDALKRVKIQREAFHWNVIPDTDLIPAPCYVCDCDRVSACLWSRECMCD